MNDLQKRELALLKSCTEICDQLDIPYFLVCGSALGAAKYSGFIPWDDDVDVGMYRADYVRFLKEAPALLPSDLFLQTYETDPCYPNIFAKLRDSKTTYIEKAVAHVPMHHGVYIDIFPLDGYPAAQAEQVQLEKKKRYYKRMLSCVYDVPRSFKGRIMAACMRFAGIHKHTVKYLRKYEKLISAYPVETSEVICNHGNWQGMLEYAPRAQYGQGAWATFEGLRVRIPEQYDAYLTQKYGDWRADLSEDQKVGHHYYSVCDLDRPYTEYIQK